MQSENMIQKGNIFTQTVVADWLNTNKISLDVLRLDTVNPVISGNKWFKLKYHLENAVLQGFKCVATFGGAYSNHIIATAYACKQYNLKCIGVIRGEASLQLSHTLKNAIELGIDLHFVSRELYKYPELIKQNFNDVFWINEGGYGAEGAKGASEILLHANNKEKYSHVICAVGTGTMLAGIIQSVTRQHVIGISAMKGNIQLEKNVIGILGDKVNNKTFCILHDYHFGGYAKCPKVLVDFMIETWYNHSLPTDFVYTAKAFFAAKKLILEHTIPKGSNVLFIHSGGLQGNLSLPQGTLPF